MNSIIAAVSGFFSYVAQRQDQILSALLEHIQLTVAAVFFAVLIGVPLGILISSVKSLNKPVLGLANVVQAVPSLAFFGFLIPVLGIGSLPTIFIVVIYALLPILKNTFTGLHNINGDILEAARGMGMTKGQILWRIQLPLALPVIMAGIRIAAVNAVGLVTVAAFVGAGGLGYLIYSGIQTLNDYLILAGAIPSCLLALLMDFVVGRVERLVTPISFRLANVKYDKTTNQRLRRTRKVAFSGLAVVLAVCIAAVGFSALRPQEKVIRVGSKNFTEQQILGFMVADLIEGNTDITVDRRINLGGTQICFEAIQSGDIDLYVDYTGTAFVNMLGREPVADREYVYEEVRTALKEQFGLEVLDELGFNNTYVLAMTPERAEEFGITSISDLAGHAGELLFSPTPEFSEREDGWLGLQTAYGLEFRDIHVLDGGIRYVSITNGSTDVITAFSTDGLLEAHNLMTLTDDQEFFVPYYAVPLVREEVLAEYPELEEVLGMLCGVLTDEVMRQLNYQVDSLGLNPEDVARQFLQEQGLI